MPPILRSYQADAAGEALKAISGSIHGVLSLPTGSGKSLVISEIARRLDGNIVVLQPTKEILEQNFAKAYEFGERQIAVWSASMGRKHKSRITFATIGSITRHTEAFADVAAVLVDEAHLVNPRKGEYLAFIKRLDKPVIGLTATPYRMHRNRVEGITAKFLHHTRPRVFSKLLYVAQNRELHDAGHLCRVVYHENPDYNPAEIALKSSSLDYDDEALATYNRLHQIGRKTIDIILENYHWCRHVLVFCSSIAESEEIAEAMKKAAIPCGHIDGTAGKLAREKLLADFKSGRIKVVTNVNVLTTGYDFPALDCIILARPTISLLLYYQMVGRCVRNAPDKDTATVFDLCGNVARFGKPDRWVIETGEHARLKGETHYLTDYDFESNRDLYSARKAAVAARETATEKRQTGTLTVTFGKYRGRTLASLPSDYIEWCAKTFENGQWKKVFIAEMERRRAA